MYIVFDKQFVELHINCYYIKWGDDCVLLIKWQDIYYSYIDVAYLYVYVWLVVSFCTLGVGQWYDDIFNIHVNLVVITNDNKYSLATVSSILTLVNWLIHLKQVFCKRDNMCSIHSNIAQWQFVTNALSTSLFAHFYFRKIQGNY